MILRHLKRGLPLLTAATLVLGERTCEPLKSTDDLLKAANGVQLSFGPNLCRLDSVGRLKCDLGPDMEDEVPVTLSVRRTPVPVYFAAEDIEIFNGYLLLATTHKADGTGSVTRYCKAHVDPENDWKRIDCNIEQEGEALQQPLTRFYFVANPSRGITDASLETWTLATVSKKTCYVEVWETDSEVHSDRPLVCDASFLQTESFTKFQQFRWWDCGEARRALKSVKQPQDSDFKPKQTPWESDELYD